MAASKEVDVSELSKKRIKVLKEMYSDQTSARNLLGKSAAGFGSKTYKDAKAIRDALEKAITSSPDDIVAYSKDMYDTNPVYASLIDYFANMYLWRYTVTPHRLPTKKISSKPTSQFTVKKEKYDQVYAAMIEVAEGLRLEAKAPLILTQLLIEGASYFTTYCDEESLTIDTITFPKKYCRKIGQTQFGTSIFQLDCSYFDSFGLNAVQLSQFLESFPEEIQKAYAAYKTNKDLKWHTLDPHFASCITLNERAIPVFAYTLGSMLNYEQYGDNELKRNENLLKYIVVHKMPIYQDQLIFEVDEVSAIHKSLSKIVNTSDKTRLITTYGDVSIERIGESESTENKVLEKAFESIFNNAGLNASIFTGESVESIKYSLLRDKARIWKYVDELMNFYNVAINNWFDFGVFQADIQVLPISQYSYADDIENYRANATLGVGKLDYIVASGIKQKNIADRFELEKFLKLEEITPLQSSYTQSDKAKSGETEDDQKDKDPKDPKNGDDQDPEDAQPSPTNKDEDKDPVKEEEEDEKAKN